MGLIQVGCIVPDNLENEETKEWLESLDSEFNYQFVEITEGDESLVKDFICELITPEEIMSGEYDDYYIALDKELLEDSGQTELLNFLEDEREKTKPLPMGEMLFRPKG